jgi:hypothetical protein
VAIDRHGGGLGPGVPGRLLAHHRPRLPGGGPLQGLADEFVHGLAEYRQGQFDRAIATLQGDASGVLGPAPRLVLALSLHRSGQATEARKLLAAAILAHDRRATQVRARDQNEWIYHILRREAEAVILPKLQAFRQGDRQPQDNYERLALLGICEGPTRPLREHSLNGRMKSLPSPSPHRMALSS